MARDKKRLGKKLKSPRKAAPSRRSSEAKSRPARGRSGKSQQTTVTKLARELGDALQQQSATAEILKVIASSRSDVQPVFDVIVQTSRDLCRSQASTIFILRGGKFHVVAFSGVQIELLQHMKDHPISIDKKGSALARAAREKRTIHIPNTLEDAELVEGGPISIGGPRATLTVPLVRDGEVIGGITLRQSYLTPYTPRQIEAIEAFADQAVIAIENGRQFNETREALERQTATADVLKVISRSAFDLQTVLDTLVESAARLCEAEMAFIHRREGEQYRAAATFGFSPEFWAFMQGHPISPGRGTIAGRVALERHAIQIEDVAVDPEYTLSQATSLARQHTTLGVPLLRENELIGVIVLARQRVELFTEKQIALVTTFADQAVIAIENTRLFDEVQAKTRDLEESLQQQTATADVLKVISRSSVELETVLETLVDTVARLCGADQVYMFHLRHDLWHLVAAWGLSAEAREFFLTHPFTPGRGSTPGRAALERRAVLIPDVLQDPEYTLSEGQKIAGYRTTLGIPLLREDALIGVFGIARTRVEAFTEKEIELATTFADQAVIAIENARLFDELRERQAELRVTFDNMGDGVVMFDAAARLTAWNRNFQEMLDLPDALLAERPSYAEYFRYLVDRGEYSTDLEADLSRANEDPRQELRIERTRPDGRVIEVRRNPVPGGGFVLIYSDITERKRAEQAVRAARDAAETALRDLQAAQDRLVQTEKLASLGQLTAGIAHEIKNPLNFVNNFSALSVELVNEMNDVLELAKLDDKNREELDEIRDLLKGNLEKVVQHGKRADSIVKNMLLHSRSGSGEHRSVEINAVIEESLNLAYHGARAEGKDFNITLERDFDPAAGVADIYPQEITRVLLNLISNGFYAATKRAVAASNGFEPKLKAVTRNLGEKVEIRIRDNGTGIPLEIREKIFNPFFTTKPAGEGTGLGLSMSHDIVAKQHGGTIDVLTEPGSFTEFIIILPRNIPAGAEAGGRDEHLYSRGR